jgi:hypothetical protein
MKEVIATIRTKPNIILPEKSNLEKRWNWAVKNYVPNPKWWQNFLGFFKPYKKLVYPVDYRIYYCVELFGKVISIGCLNYDNLHEVKSFEELLKIDVGRYISGKEYNENFGLE